MKLSLLLSAALTFVAAKSAASARLAVLREHMMETIMGVSGFEESSEGEIAVKMSLKPKKASQELVLSKKNTNSWLKLEASSPMRAKGFVEWASAPAGLRFRTAKHAITKCQADAGRNEGKDIMVVQFSCKSETRQPRFASSRHPELEEATVENNIEGAFGDDRWHQCEEGHVPFGWEQQWGVWDYPLYTVTTQGILGCRTTEADFCTPQNADLFPFAASFDWSNYIRDPDAIYS